MSHGYCSLVLWRLPDVFEVDRRHVWLPARSLQFSDYGARRFAPQPNGATHGHLCRVPGLRKRIPLRLARNEDRGIADKRSQALPGYERGRVSPRCSPWAHFRDVPWPKMIFLSGLSQFLPHVFFLLWVSLEGCSELSGIMSLT